MKNEGRDCVITPSSPTVPKSRLPQMAAAVKTTMAMRGAGMALKNRGKTYTITKVTATCQHRFKILQKYRSKIPQFYRSASTSSVSSGRKKPAFFFSLIR